jgi:hypothetical protein
MRYVVGIKGNESQVPLFAFYEPDRCADPNLKCGGGVCVCASKGEIDY